MLLFSIDPGTTNCGYALTKIDAKNKKVKYDIIKMGMIKNTLTDLKDDPALQLTAFRKEIMSILRGYKIDGIVLERFLIRSFRTPTAEQVTAMIGFLFGVFPKHSIYLYTSLTWKTAAKKAMGYPKNLDPFYKEVHCLPHEADAVFLALYHSGILPLFNTEKAKGKLICKLEKATTRSPKRIKK